VLPKMLVYVVAAAKTRLGDQLDKVFDNSRLEQ
jgi:hypothetical protein